LILDAAASWKWNWEWRWKWNWPPVRSRLIIIRASGKGALGKSLTEFQTETEWPAHSCRPQTRGKRLAACLANELLAKRELGHSSSMGNSNAQHSNGQAQPFELCRRPSATGSGRKRQTVRLFDRLLPSQTWQTLTGGQLAAAELEAGQLGLRLSVAATGGHRKPLIVFVRADLQRAATCSWPRRKTVASWPQFGKLAAVWRASGRDQD